MGGLTPPCASISVRPLEKGTATSEEEPLRETGQGCDEGGSAHSGRRQLADTGRIVKGVRTAKVQIIANTVLFASARDRPPL